MAAPARARRKGDFKGLPVSLILPAMPSLPLAPPEQSPLLLPLMAAHLVIVIIAVAAIAYALLRGATGLVPDDAPLWISLAIPAAIGLGRFANGVECILQTWAKRLRGVNAGWARDILWLPESWARAIPPLFTPLYLFAAGLVMGRLMEASG